MTVNTVAFAHQHREKMTMSENNLELELDKASRNKIVSETNKNFFVEAGAGSGKTTMLVRRMVAMVEAGIPIEKICAITFTKADCSVLNHRDSQNATYEVKTPSHLSTPSKLSENYTETVGSKESEVKDNLSNKKSYRKTAHKFPDLLGTMTHRLMEMIVSSRDRVDTEKTVDEIIREYRTEETESYEEDLKAALMDVARTMKSGGYAQSNGAPQNLLEILKGASEVYCEVPFCYMNIDNGKDEHKELWNGVIDLIYCTDGKWHIVDYKTNANGDDLDKKYLAQLEAYKKAFKANTGEEADALTYHIDI